MCISLVSDQCLVVSGQMTKRGLKNHVGARSAAGVDHGETIVTASDMQSVLHTTEFSHFYHEIGNITLLLGQKSDCVTR